MAMARTDGSSNVVPSHVAIIMDGNGRWAAARHLPRIMGHRAGVAAVRETVRAANRLGIRYLIDNPAPLSSLLGLPLLKDPKRKGL